MLAGKCAELEFEALPVVEALVEKAVQGVLPASLSKPD
jgi:hypothetical protein